MTLLDVDDVSITYSTAAGTFDAVTSVSFALGSGDFLGVVGESGCGKTTVLKAIAGILPDNAAVRSGSVRLSGDSLLDMSDRERRKVQWDRISMVPQSAMNALNPVRNLESQFLEAVSTHSDMARRDARQRARDCFEMVGLGPDRLSEYPHEFSGGMRQRAAIALSLVLDPEVIVCDEPTTGLDVIMQDQVLATLKSLQTDDGRSLVLVTHNIAAVAENCDRVAVMYAGQVVEYGSTEAVLTEPFNPYTLGLRNAFPKMNASRADQLITIPGAPPALSDIGDGCRFVDRCPFSTEQCREEPPPLIDVAAGHSSRCHYPDQVEAFRAVARKPETWIGEVGRERQTSSPATETSRRAAGSLDGNDIEVHYPMRQSLLSSLGRSQRMLHAVDGVTIALQPGRAIGLAGESGCGKSTTGMTLAGLVQPTGGSLLIGGESLDLSKRAPRRSYSRTVQVIFQDPYGSLNPRFSVGRTVEEPLRVHGIGTALQRRERVLEALDLAELRPARHYVDRFPHQLSGGQRQRISIARALVLEPQFLIADEPVSMLDVSVRAGILRLLRHLIDELGMGLLYVSHDLSTMPAVCDELAVMYMGKIVESGPTMDVLGHPLHPYTQALIAAVPTPDPRHRRVRRPLEGDVPSPIDPRPGCRFAGRCPEVTAECRTADPPLVTVGESSVQCVLYRSSAPETERPTEDPTTEWSTT